MPKQILNRGKRTITGKNSDGSVYALAAGKGGIFDDEVADMLRRLFPNEVVSMEDAQKEFTDNTSAKIEGAGVVEKKTEEVKKPSKDK